MEKLILIFVIFFVGKIYILLYKIANIRDQRFIMRASWKIGFAK